VVVGACLRPDVIQPFTALAKELELRFVVAYSAEEFETTLWRIADGRLDVEPLITSSIRLEEVPQAFEQLRTPNTQVKIVIRPGG